MQQKKKFGPFRPVINDENERIKSIKENTPALFEIKSEVDLNKPSKNILNDARTTIWRGKQAVQDNDKSIMKQAEKHNIDPDLVRSVIFAENARGNLGGFNKLADNVRVSKTILPMNINKNMWASIIGKQPNDLYNADDNIEAGTVLLRRISNRIKNPTPEKIGAIWNYIGRENTNEFGDYIGDVYRKKPWKIID